MRMVKVWFFILLLLSSLHQVSAETSVPSADAIPASNYQIIPINYQKLSIAANVRDTWALNNITSYVYTILNKCFCEIAIRARVFVFDNKIIKILDLDKANAELDPSEFEKYKTIDEHIAFINNTLKKPVDKVYIDHDRHLGFPSKIFIDPNKRQADDETNINISNLALLVLEQPTPPVIKQTNE